MTQLLGLLIIAFVVSAPAPTFHFRLDQGCELPFASIAPAQDAFGGCDNHGRMSGVSTPTAGRQLQAFAKNNLCQEMSHPLVLGFDDFDTIDANTPDNPSLSADRDDLHNIVTLHHRKISEGIVVRLVARVRGAHVSDCSSGTHGEVVNCKQLGFEHNDIHIVLLPPDDPDADECESLTAEMIPHFRPDAWSEFDLKTPVNNPVRVTGALFYDNSHSKCKHGKGSPKRRTVWEIHPVYQMDVCRSTDEADCRATNAAAWLPYDQWIQQAGSVTKKTGASQRNACEAVSNP